MSDAQKSGYLEVKEPSVIKGRKLKTWKRKWAVLQGMNNLASRTFAAKLEFYQNEASALSHSSDKLTYLLEHVTSVEECYSKTHKLAFQIVQNKPTLVLCAETIEDTDSWISIIKNIFWPNGDTNNSDQFLVSVIENESAKRCSLKGDYKMTVTPENLIIENSLKCQSMRWRLDSLKRFFMDKENQNILCIESGAKAECGEAKFEFKTLSVHAILQSIKKNIKIAIEERRKLSVSSTEPRDRSSSFENGFQTILSNSGQRSRTSSVEVSNNSPTQIHKSLTLPNSPQQVKGGSETELQRNKLSMTQCNSVGRIRCTSVNITPAINSDIHGHQDEAKSSHSRSVSLDNTFLLKRNTEEQSAVNTISSHEYDTLKIQGKVFSNEIKPNIVSKIDVDTENKKKLQILIDSHGYSHIPTDSKSDAFEQPNSSESNAHDVATHGHSDRVDHVYSQIPAKKSEIQTGDGVLHSTTDTTDMKERSLSMISTDLNTLRSPSVGSYDSGISFSPRFQQTAETMEPNHRNKESFDSAIGTSDIQVSIQDAIIVAEADTSSAFNRSFSQPSHMSQNTTNMHGNEHLKSERSHSEPAKGITLDVDHKHDVVGYATVESEYEDLDKYRKDLNKYLGMEHAKPEEVPPSLPERPSSLPPSRKIRKDRHKKKVSFPLFGGNQNSTSSSESDENGELDITVHSTWPITRKTGQNNLYEKVDKVEFQNISAESKTTNLNQEHSLYDTIPGNSKDTPSEIISSVSPIKEWPLKMTAQASCNRFYESTHPQLQETADNSKVSVDNTIEQRPPLQNSVDFLTGDSPYISSAILPVLRPDASDSTIESKTQENTVFCETDLLQLDISPTEGSVIPDVLNKNTVERRDSIQHDLISVDLPKSTNSLPVLDILLPFSIDPTIAPAVSSTENECMSKEVSKEPEHESVRSRRTGVVINPFPNIARFSGALEDFEEDTTEKHDKSENKDDPFDIFKLGVVTHSLGLANNEEQPPLIDFGIDQVSEQKMDIPEDIYMKMNNSEQLYVEPSSLNSTIPNEMNESIY